MTTIVQTGDKVLRETAKEIGLAEIKSAKIRNILKKMTDALSAAKDGVALAAPQIGVPLRVFIVLKEYTENKTAQELKEIQDYFLTNSHPDKQLIKSIYTSVCDFGRVAEGNISNGEIPLDPDFISKYCKREVSRGLLLTSLRILEAAGYLRLISDYERKSEIQIIMEKNKLKEFINNCPQNNLKDVLLIMLREFGSDIYFKSLKISQNDLVRKFAVSEIELDKFSLCLILWE